MEDICDFYVRSEAVFGKNAIERLKKSHVIVFGLGGVGGHAAEALARAGIGTLSLVDCEKYDLSNCNRQLFATLQSIGKEKVFAARERLLQVSPQISVKTYSLFYGKDPSPPELWEGADYILDAIDTVSSKLRLIEEAKKLGIPIISCMGTGNKLDPTAFRVSDIYKTKVCPLARVIRAECRTRGIDRLKVVYSEEEPVRAVAGDVHGQHVPGSVSFVPGVAGMILAGEIVKDLVKECI